MRRGSVLLGLRAPHKTCPNCWDMFGGHVESEETEVETLRRELREELGIVPTQFRKAQHLKLEQDRLNLDIAIYVVTEWIEPDPVMLGNEHTEIRWFPIEEAANLSNIATAEIGAVLRAIAE